MTKTSTNTKLDRNVKDFVEKGYDYLFDFDFLRIYWGVGLGVCAVGLILACIPFPPTMILGCVLMLLPLTVYGIGLGIVAGTDLVNRICCMITNKFEEWKNSRTSSEPKSEQAPAKRCTSSDFKEGNADSKDNLPGANQYGDPRKAGDAGQKIGDHVIDDESKSEKSFIAS